MLLNGRYSFMAGGVGEHQFSGYILMKGKEGEEIRRNFGQKYTVLPVPNTATVAADLMNVLYAGYANPISISVAWCSGKCHLCLHEQAVRS